MTRNYLPASKALQPFYEFLYKVSVRGMNYDRGQCPDKSGEAYVLKLLDKPGRAEPVIFDVGANTGQYAKVVMDTLPQPFRLHSFEPQGKAFAQLKNLSGSDCFRAHNIGLGATEASADIFYEAQGSVLASMFAASYRMYNIVLDQTEKVPVSTVDAFCAANDIRYIDLLKIDVEGYELEVLKGSKAMLAGQQIGMIQFEVGIASIEARVFVKDFFDILGQQYDIYRILQNGLRKIRYSEFAEIFLVTNYLAIRRP